MTLHTTFSRSMHRARLLRSAATLLAFGFCYFIAGKLGLKLAFVNASATAVWPPTGIAVAGLLVLGKRVWPVVLIGAFLVNITTAGTVFSSLGIAAGNTLEALCGAWLVNRFASGRHAFERAYDVLKFAVFAAIVATTLSATVGVTCLVLGKLATWAEFGSVWRTWWLGDVSGALVVAPLLVTWAANPRLTWDRRIVEFGGALLALALAGSAIFGEWFSITEKGYPLLFLLLPMLVWVAFRFAQRETATAIFVLSAIAVAGTLGGLGPFSLESQNESLLFLQGFLAMIAIMSMTLTAAVAERRASEGRLTAQQATTRILAESQTLAEAMPGILEVICKKLGWEMGNYWQVSEDGKHLECIETLSHGEASLDEFSAASKRRPMALGVGLPGRVWQRNEVIWIDDVLCDSNFPRAPFAEKAGLHSALALPVMIDGGVFGVIEFFTREFRGSKSELLDMVAAVASQIGQFAEHRLAEKALQGSEALYRTMAETASDAFLTINENSTILFANRAAEQTFGYAATEMVGQSLTMLMPEDMQTSHRRRLSRYLQTGRKGMSWRSVELSGRHKSGRIFPLEISIGDFEQNGRHLFTGIARDISERKRIESMLAQHACIVESSNDAIYSKTLEGVITSWNKAAESLYGYAASEILGKDVMLLVPPERIDEEREMLERVGRGEHVPPYETARLRKDGTSIDVSLTLSPIKTGDRISSLSAIARDVSERKRVAAEIERQRASAEAANQAKDKFLAALSHELRTPLTPVLMVAATMEHSEDVPEQIRKDFTMIRTNIELEARIIDDLLDLTRITQGKLALRFEQVDAHRLIEHALEILRSEIQNKEIAVTLDLSAGEHQLSADSVRLEQVFWNIFKNAVKFTPRAGQIEIRSWNTPGNFHVTIADTGLGITPEELPRIFDAFAQGEEAGTPRFGGLGLGLSISALLVREHRGRIWADSPGRGKGATFHVELPITPQLASTDTSRQIASPNPAPGLRILLVEDHEATRETLDRLLTRRGYVVQCVGSVAEAFATARSDRFDMVISDLGLPDGHGNDLMRELCLEFGLPGIALSGYGMERDIENSKEAGFQEHITKPVDLPRLEDAIHRIIASRNPPMIG